MTPLRLLTILVTFAAISLANTYSVQASHLRNDQVRSLEKVSTPPPIQEQSDSSSSAGAKLTDVTQDSQQMTSDVHSGASASDDKSIESEIKLDGSAVEEVGGVRAWAQCGGVYYRGETKCVRHTFCKELSEFISVCFPEAKPTEKVVRLEL